jgi:hypothetical protein
VSRAVRARDVSGEGVRFSKVGIDGALLSWPIYEEGMLDFRKNTMPLLKQAGLRT